MPDKLYTQSRWYLHETSIVVTWHLRVDGIQFTFPKFCIGNALHASIHLFKGDIPIRARWKFYKPRNDDSLLVNKPEKPINWLRRKYTVPKFENKPAEANTIQLWSVASRTQGPWFRPGKNSKFSISAIREERIKNEREYEREFPT